MICLGAEEMHEKKIEKLQCFFFLLRDCVVIVLLIVADSLIVVYLL